MCQSKQVDILADSTSAARTPHDASASIGIDPSIDALSGYEPPAPSRWGWAAIAAVAAGVIGLVAIASD